ncbi:diguanylate cyclase (GGDEF)-like protein [Paraburkholderia atlantica]|uniref:Diguanylate cyclase (GGDEF)-like protein n=1 Tax=Paraburkholderia atlantica TaxID=2654982 RepID=A0A6I1PS33_PARAM|nr:GGDEF domain-containing protein [Paraburkholderia atlantica]MBB5419512.1 diguanylate cyclase (GGDEF)-like protein [Paraburkholderia atlantica]MBB5422027.1 diguanylate cyclase (GGDEF)-like protein [Paraburkholderia atlantica]MPW07666.1 diguanylate cyclase [Paraburkholderia atlantica]NUY31769.1 GGDEF domain-containing protein [Paraburkholderia atlantica]
MTTADSNKIRTPIPEHAVAGSAGQAGLRGAAHARGPVWRFRPGPASVAVAALLCLLFGLLYVAIQIRTVFSDQLKQEYAGLVLEAAERVDSAREQLAAWKRMADTPASHDASFVPAYEAARAELARRFASLAALVNASPSPAPPIPSMSPTQATPEAVATVLGSVSAYWRAQRDASSADVRLRVAHVARTLIALAALLFCMLITALGMYAKRNRQLAGQSHEFELASLHDSLTGLSNRRKLLAALDAAAKNARTLAVEQRLAVLYIDLDGFKQVNDSFGHRTGDEFLAAVSARFRASVRKGDLVARIGGDEFAVLVRTFAGDDELAEIARRLMACVVETDEQMGIGRVRASVGIASYPDDVDDHRRLIAAADAAMYQVKRDGKNGFAFAAQTGREAAM